MVLVVAINGEKIELKESLDHPLQRATLAGECPAPSRCNALGSVISRTN